MNASQQPPTLSYAYPPGMALGPQVSPVRQTPTQVPGANLGSNNPFRNRALSPSNSVASGGRPERPTSTNPFLDDYDPLSPQSAPTGTMVSPVDRQDITNTTRDLFENLSLKTKPAEPTGYRPTPPRSDRPFQNGSVSSSQRPTTARERPERRGKDALDIFADPPGASLPRTRDRDRRPRRNSESSIMERPKLLDPEDERRRRERRRREREGRQRDGKPRSSKKNNYQLDIIDKLDVTSIYGTGMFHHDGPFDACNPNRNRKGLRTAPMQAFPADSTNMALGGAGPVNQNINLDLFHGRTEEGYNDFGAVESRRVEGVNFDPTSRIEPVHGSESMGLGTSTFLDGAPASRAAIQRGETENDQQFGKAAGGLQRKKSLAQRLRGVSNRPSSGRVVSPEASYIVPAGSGHIGHIKANEKNPFFQDYDDAWEKKGARIAEESRGLGRARSSSSPKQGAGLERRHTDDRSYGFEEGRNANGGGGFINRMKSLRKPRPERRISDD
ncbi:Pal1 cell morphology protein-domain-containing protein [Aspergillus coremiiformis]|uniref:Pal1 cell morphology protein-domain-containing protein n=1 Tax=Aspergillus coremiiformis TaxID=138285 RepID=A0A5N6Z4X3_9EURO|nr:Pal1 cell morphology protein-domain-containing protein [Aspergillus coremiiformis]